MKIGLSILVLFMINLMSIADEERATVPVKLAIEPFYELIIDSKAYELDASSNKVGTSSIEAGGLHLGSIQYSVSPLAKVFNQPVEINSSHVTVHNITVINNSKPFRLVVNVHPTSSGKKNILELKDRNNAEVSALKVKVKNDAATRYSENLPYSEEWQGFKPGESLVVYQSHGKIVSDIVNVEMAIVNIDPQTKSDIYGGQLIWTLESEI